jgi:hypothetical protein
MSNATLKRVILVYLVLIPVMWFLTEAIWGGLHGARIGLKMGMQDPQSQESIAFNNYLKAHGISESTSKEDVETWFNNLSSTDRKELNNIILNTIGEKDLVSFGSAFVVCVIVFGIIGFVSGAFTGTWQFVGILPTISFLLNNPVIRFQSILDISLNQKILVILIGQFLVCYVFAFTGVFLRNSIKKRKHKQKVSDHDN